MNDEAKIKLTLDFVLLDRSPKKILMCLFDS